MADVKQSSECAEYKLSTIIFAHPAVRTEVTCGDSVLSIFLQQSAYESFTLRCEVFSFEGDVGTFELIAVAERMSSFEKPEQHDSNGPLVDVHAVVGAGFVPLGWIVHGSAGEDGAVVILLGSGNKI